MPDLSVETYKALVDAAPDAVVVIDAEGAIVLVNRQAEDMFGYKKEDLTGRQVEMLLPERFRAAHVGHRNKYDLQPGPRAMGVGLELYGRRSDGRDFPVEISLSPVQIEEGMLVSAAVRDISPRRQIEATVRRLAAIVESSNDAMFSKDLDGIIESWSPGAEQLYGFTAEEVVGGPVSVLAEPSQAGELESILDTVRRGERVDRMRTQRFRKDGSAVAVSVTVSPIRDALGRVVGASSVTRDISDLQRVEQRFGGLLEAAPDATVVAGDGGLIRHVNRQAEKMFGYQKEQLIGRPVEVLLPERFRDAHLDHRNVYNASPRSRAMGPGLELSGRRSDGTEFPVEISLSPLKVDDELLVTAAIRDITERKRLDDALRRSNQELEQFAYVASHDLQEPLRKVASFCELLRQEYGGKLDEMADMYIDYAIDGAFRMRELINGLLEFSRVGRGVPELELVDIRRVVELALRNLESAREDGNATVEVGELPLMKTAPSQLVQLYQNIVGNAIKFRGRDRAPAIRIGSERQEGAWLFWVADNGIGIDAEHVDRIFEVFRRLHTRVEFPGSGIGLAICRRIVEHLGGTMWVESEPGEGSTFFWTLPD